MILSDRAIKERIAKGDLQISSKDGADPLKLLGPASIDFRLGNTFKRYKKDNHVVIDALKGVDPKQVKTKTLEEGQPFIVHPGSFVLGVTMEKIKVPRDLTVRCEGRSSLGRLGIIIHSTAGFIDPGFEGTVTLEITNINEVPVALYPGMRIGQLAVESMVGEVDISYDERKGSKYMHQELPQESRIDRDTEYDD
ncbi:MAG: dCTP deaminase [Candidatus Gracilibacteria bacterium]|nr:dCTP deaminase [Candidatus Gracilibacteria bacterium]